MVSEYTSIHVLYDSLHRCFRQFLSLMGLIKCKGLAPSIFLPNTKDCIPSARSAMGRKLFCYCVSMSALQPFNADFFEII